MNCRGGGVPYIFSYFIKLQCIMSVLQHGPGRQNFGWVGHNALGLPIIGLYIQLILRKISKKNWCRQMSDFKAEMHQIRFPLGRVGSATYPRSPDPWLYLRGLLLQGWRGGEGRGRGRGRNKKGREGKRDVLGGIWPSGPGPPDNFGVTPPMSCITWAPLFPYLLCVIVII